MATKRFLFDGAFRQLGGLSHAFTRAVQTRNFDGSLCPSGTPRYSRPLPIAPAASAAPVTIIDEGAGTAATAILGHGFNATGSDTWWAIRANTGAAAADGVERLYIVKTSDPANNGTSFTDTTQYSRTLLKWIAAASAYDVMNGAVTEGHYPQSARIVYGCVVLQCVVFNKATGAAVGTSIVYATDAASKTGDNAPTWTLFWQDGTAAAPYVSGQTRGQIWSLSDYYTPGRADAAPLAAWIAGADYQNQVSSNGRFFAFRMTRTSATGTDWLPDHTRGLVSSDKVVDFTLSNAALHSHSCGLFRSGNDLCWANSVGDTVTNNRIILYTLANWFTTHAENPVNVDYTNNANWTIDDDWHGRDGTAGTDAEEGYQFVGCVQGPAALSLIVGSDNHSGGAIFELTKNSGGFAALSWVAGLVMSVGEAPLGTQIGGSVNCLRLARTGSAYVGIEEVATNSLTATGNDRDWGHTILYSVGAGAGTWVAVARVQTAVSPIIAGGYIYWADAGATIKRIPIPTPFVRRPLVVGPGGRSAWRSDYDVVDSSGTITAIARNGDGHFYDPDNGAQLPDPPTMLDRIVLIESSGGSGADGIVAHMSPDTANDAPTTDPTIFADWNGTNILANRMLLLDGTVRSGSPERSAGKLFTGTQEWRDFVNPQKSTGHQCMGSDRWFPSVNVRQFNHGTPPIENMFIEWRASATSSRERNRFFAAPVDWRVGNQMGYPLPPWDGSSATVHPAEVSTITGFSFGAATPWSALLAFVVSEDGWDQCVADADRKIPFATIYVDVNNYVEFRADLNNKRIEVFSRVASTAETAQVGLGTFMRLTPLFLGVSYNPSTNLFNVAVSFAGGAVATANITTANDFGAALTSLKLGRSATDESNQICVLGGTLIDDAALSEAALASNLGSGSSLFSNIGAGSMIPMLGLIAD